MATALFRAPAARSALRAANTATAAKAGLAGVSFTRGKATLPALPYAYDALEPAISGQIMEIHHTKHHQTYVNSYNTFTAKLAEITQKSDPTPADLAEQMSIVPMLKFHGGGHVNHSLFWENLAPKSQGGGDPPTGALAKAIDEHYGSLDKLKEKMNATLAGIQGSGWAWLVQDIQNGSLAVVSMPNQDPITAPFRPLLGIDAWEHAYYLQYENRKAEYFNNIWDVINWKTVEKRFK